MKADPLTKLQPNKSLSLLSYVLFWNQVLYFHKRFGAENLIIHVVHWEIQIKFWTVLSLYVLKNACPSIPRHKKLTGGMLADIVRCICRLSVASVFVQTIVSNTLWFVSTHSTFHVRFVSSQNHYGFHIILICQYRSSYRLQSSCYSFSGWKATKYSVFRVFAFANHPSWQHSTPWAHFFDQG